jgi:PAS domain S-box-containing protein
MTGSRREGSSRREGASGQPDYALVRILAEAGTVGDAAGRLLALIAHEFGWAYGALWLADERAELLRMSEDWSVEDPGLHEFRRLSRRLTFNPGLGLLGRVWVSGEPAWIVDVCEDPNFARAEVARRAGLHAAVGLPVLSAGVVLGVMEFLGRDARPADPGELELLRTLGRHVGEHVARARAEQRLRATEDLSASIVEAALDCVITMDHEGRVVDFNPAAEATFGYRRAEAVGRTVAELVIPPALRDAHTRALSRYLQTGEPTILNRRLEMTGTRADGSTMPVELTVTRIAHSDPPLFAGFVRDISERVRSQEEVTALLAREHEARVRAEDAERAARRVADALQRSLLPPHLPEIPGVELGAAYRAGSEGSVVGGDFYDVFDLGAGRWGIAIGDVRGKGPDAASLTALVRYTIRTAAVREASPSAILAIVNDALLRDTPAEDFCTAIYASVDVSDDAPTVHLSVGGHPLPFVLSAEGHVRTVGQAGTLLGAVADPALRDHRLALAPHDLLLLYTDGLIEARTRTGRLGVEGLRALLGLCAHQDAEAVAHRLEALADPSSQRTSDDVALLALRAGG